MAEERQIQRKRAFLPPEFSRPVFRVWCCSVKVTWHLRNVAFCKGRYVKLAPLYSAYDGRWVEIPEWGQFFLRLGYTLALRHTHEYRTVIGLALPTRAYGASLMATGLVAGRSEMRIRGTESETHFRQLCTLAPGTSLYYRRTPTNLVRVCFLGYEEIGGEPKIRIADDMHQYVLSPQLAEKVEVAPRPFRQHSRKKVIEPCSPFFASFFESEAEAEHAYRSCLDCIIIGSVGRIKEEVTATTFGVQSRDGKLVKGSLQDILRVKHFSRAGQAHRSDVYSPQGQEWPGSIERMTSFVVFDGASSFLTCRERWRLSHWILLIDYTDTRFDEALAAFNEEYIKHHIRDGGIDGPLTVPTAVTIAAFQETWT